jgi:hypothetical protein
MYNEAEHWVISACLTDGSIILLDSIAAYANQQICMQLCEVFESSANGGFLTVQIRSSQRQTAGSNNCALFAIANGECIAREQDPAEVTFDEDQMRPHLLQCLQNGVLTPFPTVPPGSKRPTDRTTQTTLQLNIAHYAAMRENKRILFELGRLVSYRVVLSKFSFTVFST